MQVLLTNSKALDGGPALYYVDAAAVTSRDSDKWVVFVSPNTRSSSAHIISLDRAAPGPPTQLTRHLCAAQLEGGGICQHHSDCYSRKAGR